MLLNFIVVFLPLFLGYAINLNKIKSHESWLKVSHHLLNAFVYIILFCMGANLARLDNLASNVQLVLFYSGIFFITIILMNFLVLFCYHYIEMRKLRKLQTSKDSLVTDHSGRIQWYMLKASLWLCFAVLAGFMIQFLTDWSWSIYASDISQYSLSLLIFLVGVQLRYSKISLKQIVLNKQGLVLTLIIAISSLLAGAIATLFTDLPLKMGLALSSGFGWYSLSGIMMTNAYGPVIGSTAFINDLAREILVIIAIPIYTARFPIITLGLSGATSMDFTLPILQKNGGITIVPVAIVQGFLLSLLGIILLTLLS